MAPENYRDDEWEVERDFRPEAANARRARRYRDSDDDEYVDWSKTRRLSPRRREKKSNILAFGVPFVLASLVLLWFSLHGRNNSISRYAERSASERADVNGESASSPKDDVPYQKTDVNAPENDESSLANELEPEADSGQETQSRNNYRIVSHKNPSAAENITLAEIDAEPSEKSDAQGDVQESTSTPLDMNFGDPIPEREYDLPFFSTNTVSESADEETGDALTDVGETTEESMETEAATEMNVVEDVDPVQELGDLGSLDVAFDSENMELGVDVEESDATPATQPEPEQPTGPTEEELAALRAQITQLEFALDKIKANDLRDPDEALEALDSPLADAQKLVAEVPTELQEDARRALDKLTQFSEFITTNADFLRRLETLDDAVMTEDGARAFFAPYLESDVATNAAQSPEVAQYEQELARVAKTLEPLRAVDAWNKFIEENGERLEKFHVEEQIAQNALNFIKNAEKNDATPPEIKLLQKREAEWRYDVEHKLATQRKIFIALDKENSQNYWTYAPATNLFYYLAERPKAGVNVYSSDSKGTPKYVRIPENAREIGLEESPQKAQLAALLDMVWKIPDSLRDQDTAQWYVGWCELLTALLKTDQLDPILQYSLFKEIGETLSASDYRFESRLAPLLKVLNAPQLEEKGAINRFQSESDEIKALRSLAASRLKFVPKDHLVVNKTTEQLNAQVERCSFRYQRVGWLDRDYSGEPKLRRGNNVEAPTGELWVFAPDDKQTTWRKIGDLDGEQVNLTIATDAIPRGSIVFCRTPLRSVPKTARRNVEDAIFRR